MTKSARLEATRHPFVIKKTCNVLPPELPDDVSVQDFFDDKKLPNRPNILASDILTDLQRDDLLTVQVQGVYYQQQVSHGEVYFFIDTTKRPWRHDGHEEGRNGPDFWAKGQEEDEMLFTTSLGHMSKIQEGVLNCLSLEVQVPLPKEIRSVLPNPF